MAILMKCGHSANAEYTKPNGDKVPACVICNCTETVAALPTLIGRKAKCAECGVEWESSYLLPFFKYNENLTTDEFYCGCKGWD